MIERPKLETPLILRATDSDVILESGLFGVLHTNEAESLIEDWLPTIGVGVLYGASGIGKTTLMVAIGRAVSLGWDAFGRKTKQGGVVYCCFENPNEIKRHDVAWCKANGSDIRSPMSYMSGLTDLDTDYDAIEELLRKAKQHKGHGCELVIVDTLSVALGGKEENNDNFAIVLADAKKWAETYSCFVMFIHHEGKNSARGARGGSTLKGNSNVYTKQVKDDFDSTAKSLRGHLRVEKSHHYVEGLILSYTTRLIAMETNLHGKQMWSTIAEPVDTNNRARMHEDRLARAERLPRRQQQVFELVHALVEARGGPVPGRDNVRAVSREVVDAAIAEVGKGDPKKGRTDRHALKRAIADMLASGTHLASENDLIWPTRGR